MSSVLSPLSVGVGCWNGDIELQDCSDVDEWAPPPSWDGGSEISTVYHKYNKTSRVPSATYTESRPSSRAASAGRTPRLNSARSICSDRADGELILPKTFLTRRGALMLFTAPEKIVPGLTPEEANYIRQRLQQNMDFTDVGRSVPSIKELYKMILTFGQTAQSETGGKIMMKFLRGMDQRSVDITTQPGGDFSSYVREYKPAVSSRPATAMSTTVHFESSVGLYDTLATLDHELGHKRSSMHSLKSQLDSRRGSSQYGRHVLSSEKLTASVRSLSRPHTAQATPSQPEKVQQRAVGSAVVRRPPSSKSSQDGRVNRKRMSARRVRMPPTAELGSDVTNQDDGQPIGVEIAQADRLLRRPQSSRPVLDRPGSSMDRPGSRLSDRPPSRLDGGALHDALEDAAMGAGQGFVDYYEHGGLYEEYEDEDYDGEFIPYEGDVEDEIYDDDADWSDEEQQPMDVSVTYTGLLRSGSAQKTFSIDQTLPESHDLNDVTIDEDLAEMVPHEDALMELRPHFSDEDIDSVSNSEFMLRPPPPSSPTSTENFTLHTSVTLQNSVTEHEDYTSAVDTLDDGRKSVSGRTDGVTLRASVNEGVTLDRVKSASDRVSSAASDAQGNKVSDLAAATQRSKTDLVPATADCGASGVTSADVMKSREGSPKLAESRVSSGRKSGKSSAGSSVSRVSASSKSSKSSSRLSTRSRKSSPKTSVSSKATSKTGLSAHADGRDHDLTNDSDQLNHDKLSGERHNLRVQAWTDENKSETESASPLPRTETFTYDSLLNEVSAIKEQQKAELQREKQRRSVDEDAALTSRSQALLGSPHQTSTHEEATDQPEEKPEKVFVAVHERPPSLADIMKKRKAKPKKPAPPGEDQSKSAEKVETSDHEGEEGSEGGDKDGEGMTVEELELEKKILEAKMKAAEENLDHQDTPAKLSRKASVRKVSIVKKSGKKTPKHREPTQEEELEKQRIMLREQRQAEKMRRLEEAMALQQQIREKEEEKKKDLMEAEEKRKEVESQMAELAREASNAEELEEEVKVQMAAARAAARDERMQKRKEEMERRKQEAISRRQRERNMVDAAREREIEMLEGIMDADAKEKMWNEEKARQAEADRLHQEKLEADMKRALEEAEEEESRIAQIEMQTEEETLAKIRQERDEADIKRRKLMAEAEKLQEEEEKRRVALLDEQMRVAEERRRQLDEEKRKRDEERQRLLQLHIMEEQAREQLRIQKEMRRQGLLRRREHNLEARNNLDGMRHSQDTTRPWVFSYYILWPRSTYERPIGGESEKRPRTGASKRAGSKTSTASKPMSAPARAS